MHMNLKSYRKLSPALQLAEIIRSANFLVHRIEGKYLVRLFKMNDFFIETYFHTESQEVDGIESFYGGAVMNLNLQESKAYLPPKEASLKVE